MNSSKKEVMENEPDQKPVSTREKIIQSSLKLFAAKGYDGVSVREIARAVGVRESALYRHFKNKDDILQKVIAEIQERIAHVYVQNQVPEKVSEDVADGYRKLTTENLCDISWNLFLLYTKDPMVSNFRKLLMREQFGNENIAKLYNQFFLEGAADRQAETFKALVRDGFFIKEDPKVIALQFYGPILLLFQRYDCEPEKESEIKELFIQHVKTFGKNFSSSKGERG